MASCKVPRAIFAGYDADRRAASGGGGVNI